MGKEILSILAETFKILQYYDFPGNVRELENIVERAVILARDNVWRTEFLELNQPPKKQISAKRGTLEDFKRQFILQTLDGINWRVGETNGAAVKLCLKRTTLISKMEKLGIPRQLLPSFF